MGVADDSSAKFFLGVAAQAFARLPTPLGSVIQQQDLAAPS